MATERKMEMKFTFNLKKLLMWFLIIFLFVPGILAMIGEKTGVVEQIPVSQAVDDVKQGRVDKVEVRGDELMMFYKEDGDKKVRISRKEEGSSLVEILQRAGVEEKTVKVEIASQSFSKAFWGVISLVAPLIGFGLLMFLLTKRQMGGPGDIMFGMGKSRAKLFAKGKQPIRFKDVAGVDEAKKELEEVVDFLKNPKKYKEVGARTPKGVLLTGPSGVGKTLLAKAVAGEAGVPFFSMAGSEFMEMLVGVGASRVRDLFDTAKKASPAIIFIDEIDAIGRVRGVGTMGGHDEREQTLNQILVEMDGFTTSDNVMVMAATNRPDVLDPALVRPGRFDRRVNLDLPDIAGRKAIIKIHMKGKPFGKDMNWDKVAEMTVGFSGADLENMLNEAAILTARDNKKQVGMTEIREAAIKVKLGPEKKRLQSKKERLLTAYHEAGHAVVGHVLPGTDPIQRVSIVSRGMALGYTMSRPTADKYQETEKEMKDQLAALLGGRAAEKMFCNELTGGAASDIERATGLARRMVVDLGMSSLGPISFGPSWEMTSWGKEYTETNKWSDQMQAKIDEEVKKLVDNGYKLAEKTLNSNKDKVERLVKRLIKIETIEYDDFEKIMEDK